MPICDQTNSVVYTHDITEFSTVEYGRIEGYVCRLVEQHSSLLEQINSIRLGDSDVESERLYRELANLEPIVNLFNQIKCKEKVCKL